MIADKMAKAFEMINDLFEGQTGIFMVYSSNPVQILFYDQSQQEVAKINIKDNGWAKDHSIQTWVRMDKITKKPNETVREALLNNRFMQLGDDKK